MGGIRRWREGEGEREGQEEVALEGRGEYE